MVVGGLATLLEFTPLEFETATLNIKMSWKIGLEFTPLEFETSYRSNSKRQIWIRIYSVGV